VEKEIESSEERGQTGVPELAVKLDQPKAGNHFPYRPDLELEPSKLLSELSNQRIGGTVGMERSGGTEVHVERA
jgi:hypothetical protein